MILVLRGAPATLEEAKRMSVVGKRSSDEAVRNLPALREGGVERNQLGRGGA